MKNTNITFKKKLASTLGFNKNKIKLVTLETQHSVRCVHVSSGKIYTLIPNHIYLLEQYEFNEYLNLVVSRGSTMTTGFRSGKK